MASTTFSNKKGFTLIEIMIVIVIMGILAAVAVPHVLGMIEQTQRKLDATNAIQLSNILKRAYQTETVKFPEGDAKNNLKSNDMSIAVIVSNDGVNYYRGSGAVLVNGGDWTSDNGDAYRRIRLLFEEAGFTNVAVRAKNTNGGWACYGAALFSDGHTTIFSATEKSKCTSATSGGAYESFLKNNLSSGQNPISIYLPAGVQ